MNAETESQIGDLGLYYRLLNKKVYAVFDKQKDEAREKIASTVDYCYEATEHGIENVVLKGIKTEILIAYGLHLVADGLWPQHLSEYKPYDAMGAEDIYTALFKYFKWSKGDGTLADLVQFCPEDEMPKFITDTIYSISETIYSKEQVDASEADEIGLDSVIGI